MNYAEIKAAVQTLTGRDDMAAVGGEIEVMIQAATNRMHLSDFYARDLAENTVDLGTEGYAFSFATSTFTRYRKLQQLRKTSALSGGTASTIYKHLDPLNLLDTYSREKNDVWYEAGSSIVLRSSSPVEFVIAQWYQYPVITPIGNYASWIAELVPHAIIFDACSLIFQMVAQQDQARKFDALVLEQLQQVRMHGVAGAGR